MSIPKFKGKFQEASNKHRGRCYGDRLDKVCFSIDPENFVPRKGLLTRYGKKNTLTVRQVWTCPLSGMDHYWPENKSEPEMTFNQYTKLVVTGEVIIPKEEE
jgi:hypothetical protein